MNMEFKYVPAGMFSELEALTLDEVCRHYHTHLDNFMLDEYLGASYFNRFLAEPQFSQNQQAVKCFIHLMQKLVQLNPFNPSIMDVMTQLNGSPENKAKAALLKKFTIDEKFVARISHLQSRGKHERARELVVAELEHNLSNPVLADMLLDMDLSLGVDPGQWIPLVGMPDLFINDWKLNLVRKHAKAARFKEAVSYWEQVENFSSISLDIVLNSVAASYLNLGDKDKADALFARSLEIDPLQTAISLVRKELADPFEAQKGVLQNNSVPVCIYSFNKDELLEMTLNSVCQSDLGKSDIIVLLNGCSDDSLGAVERIKSQYPNVAIELIVMPVNIGAPAARNYLVDHVLKTRKTDYVAFLDDDVEVPVNWLESLISAIGQEPDIGAVGCRVLNPGGEIIQYLFRNTSIVKPGIFRLSLACTNYTTDIGLYNVIRDVDSVMGCCHLIRTECFQKVPAFDISFSPSQLDDVAFHLDLRLQGYKVRYLGQLACTHHRSTGFMNNKSNGFNGNALGNDVKFYYRFLDDFEKLKSWQQERNKIFL